MLSGYNLRRQASELDDLQLLLKSSRGFQSSLETHKSGNCACLGG